MIFGKNNNSVSLLFDLSSQYTTLHHFTSFPLGPLRSHNDNFSLHVQLLHHVKSKKMDLMLTAVAGPVWQSVNGNCGVYSSSAGGDHAAGRQRQPAGFP